MTIMSPEQCRAARGWLKLTQLVLARNSGISKVAVIDFEKSSREPTPKTVDALQTQIEAAGVHFLFDRDGMPTGMSALELPIEAKFLDRDLTLTPEQSRAARGWLDWTQQDLARYSGVILPVIRDFERAKSYGGRKPPRAKAIAMARRLSRQRLSLRAVAGRLAEAGFLSPSGKAYGPGSIAAMLGSEVATDEMLDAMRNAFIAQGVHFLFHDGQSVGIQHTPVRVRDRVAA